ncbi:MAG TPA: histidinol-phosphate transaminase [Chitinophagaceae bacterium]
MSVMKFELQKLIRDNIRKLTPYSSARHEFKGEASVFLDANENSFGSPLPESFNRYPDPLQWQLKFELAKIKGVPAEYIFIGNGSDEVIDLAYRIFCNPKKDNVILCPPTYGMYEVSANINDVEIRKVNLTENFQLDVDGILAATDQNTKLLFICSPNNPTGNNMKRADVELLLNNFPGIVIIDEAYINFSRQKTFIQELTEYENLIVMQTLSKAWGLASLRLGLAFASLPIIEIFNKVKPPYNINKASQALAIEALQNTQQVNDWIKQTVEQREFLIKKLSGFSFVKKIFESDANFLLVRVGDARALYNYLSQNKIIVRNRSKEIMCDNCLRITIGTPAENLDLIKALKNYE